MLSRIGHILWKTIKWTLLIAVPLFALLVLINWRDEALSDEALALLETTLIEVPDNENIFVAMAGFNAPEEDDIFEAGRREIEKIKSESVNGKEVTIEPSKEKGEKREKLRWREVKPAFDCEFDKKTNFLECVRFQKERLEKTLVANETFIRRYRLLQELPHYAVPLAAQDWGALEKGPLVRRVQTLLIAQSVLEVAAGNAIEGLTFFKQDMALWRRSLEGKSNAPEGAVAVTMMTNGVIGVSFLLSSPSVGIEAQASEWREMLAPLSHKQARLRPVVEAEFRFIQKSLSEVPHNPPVYRLNATNNHLVPLFETWLTLVDLPWKNYIEQRDEARVLLADLYKPKINWAYNPIGKMLGNIAYQSLDKVVDNMAGRFHDNNAYLRLVRLQLELRLAKIPSEEIPAFIEQLDEPYCAPCSDFSWDAETRMLSFQPYNEKNFTRHASASVYVPDVRGP